MSIGPSEFEGDGTTDQDEAPDQLRALYEESGRTWLPSTDRTPEGGA